MEVSIPTSDDHSGMNGDASDGPGFISGQKLGKIATDFETRFRSRPCTQPHVVGLDGSELDKNKKRPQGHVRSVNGFFPPVKKSWANSAPNTPTTFRRQKAQDALSLYGDTYQSASKRAHPQFILELGPAESTTRKQQPKNMIPKAVRSKTNLEPEVSLKMQDTPSARSRASLRSRHSLPGPPVYAHVHYEHLDDLANLPKHPPMVVSRDNPWVYRYKVKKNMNQLNQIMASRTPRLKSAGLFKDLEDDGELD